MLNNEREKLLNDKRLGKVSLSNFVVSCFRGYSMELFTSDLKILSLQYWRMSNCLKAFL